jgi:hypothetical protein
MLMSMLKKAALKLLGLNEDQYILALELDSRPKHHSWAMEVLDLEESDLILLRRIRKAGNPITFAEKVLGVTQKKIEEFKEWVSLSKMDKLRSLVSKDESIRGFFNNAYLKYRTYKRNNNALWKKQHYKVHILAIKKIIDDIIVLDEMSWDQAYQIAYRSYFAIWCAVRKNKEKTKQRTIAIKPSTVAKAA